ncbi:MAG: alpha-1,4-glucan--maltose-1-phosphate maltosyltransferase [Spirochaetales bacterium]|nr:alpha-1,4-glucan--maltose-1-phosphate maltosyltransferase [Spirochaetales bacterium]
MNYISMFKEDNDRMNTNINTVIIENVYPEIDCGSFAVKRTVGDVFHVEADIFSHGHEVIKAVCMYRKQGAPVWTETEMIPATNDRWEASFCLDENTAYEYTFFAWRDPFLSWAEDLEKKYTADQDITSELIQGKSMIESILPEAKEEDKVFLKRILTYFDRELKPARATEDLFKIIDTIEVKSKEKKPISSQLAKMRKLVEAISPEKTLIKPAHDPVSEIILGEELKSVMYAYADRSDCGRYGRTLRVEAIRKKARFSSWYEMWHRSQGTVKGKSATFDDMIARLPEIQDMGFDVIYLPPVHPIGITNRKGPNNSLICPPGSPGCPFAIGSKEGGHTAIHSELGTIEDFRRFEKECRKLGMEIALDLALQSSPDHPWVTEHPEWYYKRPDGTIKYAENPPKKYEDIYPLNFNTKDREGLWKEILSVIRFWMDQGIRIFRVDNPHTKPVFFWQWLIEEIHRKDPDVIFLAEAFTRPKIMKALAKAGFTQSYTYFTWRNFKQELTDYFTELTRSQVAEYMIGNLFTNTPDILPVVLQNAPRSAFKMRAVLAATLSPTWGIYNGFELCEGTPKPGTEEYLNSEKYQYKVWDWDRPGHIKAFIKKLNVIRKAHPALQSYKNLRFYAAENENILFYGKYTPDLEDIVLVIVNLDPYKKEESYISVPIEEFHIRPDESYEVIDLLSEEKFYWQGIKNFISLDPEKEPAHILLLRRWTRKEQDFDYYF